MNNSEKMKICEGLTLVKDAADGFQLIFNDGIDHVTISVINATAYNWAEQRFIAGHGVNGDKESWKRKLQPMSLAELAAEIRDTRQIMDGIKSVHTEWYHYHEYLTIDVVPDRMADDDVESVKVAGVGRLQCKADIRCSCPAINKEALEQWLTDNGQEALIGKTVNSGSLKAYVKEQIKQGSSLYPKELLKIEPYSRAAVVKA